MKNKKNERLRLIPRFLVLLLSAPSPFLLHSSIVSLLLSQLCQAFPWRPFEEYRRGKKRKKKKISKMLLGKRPRPPMKRTTSMTEITFDLNTSNAEAPSSGPHKLFDNYQKQLAAAGLLGGFGGPQMQANGGGGAAAASVAGDGGGSSLEGLDQRLLATVSPRVHRKHSVEFMETPHFLRSCGLCRRRLVPGRDIYMYRGDGAFCSLECRQHQINQDEKREKCSTASKKQATGSSATRSDVSTKDETVAAV
ncbi:uncharacterized protein LOC111314957 [Durio zibethinus]|uniref:Uncharacterized protein LOC111314957 n=1 Tax=Durio zibethinus TaxID=66656 RepID=A0A6P6B5J8_DURZI|nr:uncharacterized protein LOC111314957 [Durio zibethinus]